MCDPPIIYQCEERLIDASLNSVIVNVSSVDCQIVQPTENLRRKPATAVLASDLKISKDALSCHFLRQPLKSLIADRDVSKIAANLRAFLDKQKELLLEERQVLPAIKECEADIIKRLNILRKGVVNNEAELRYAIADPIMTLLCHVWHLEAKKEESVKEQLEAIASVLVPPCTPPTGNSHGVDVETTPGQNARAGITDTSKCDYTVYSLRKAGEVTVIFVEAKTTMHRRFQHARGPGTWICNKTQ